MVLLYCSVTVAISGDKQGLPEIKNVTIWTGLDSAFYRYIQ